MKFECHPLTLNRWGDLEALFGPRGACGGCWCMWWRRRRSVFEAGKGADNKRAFKRLVRSGASPGLIGYVDGKPAGWIALAPREDYPALGRSRILKPVDAAAVWSVTCFFIARDHRRRGVSVRMLKAAVRFAKSQGARIVEGYPTEPKQTASPDAFVWTGLASGFRKAGFEEVLRRSPTRPIMRKRVRR